MEAVLATVDQVDDLCTDLWLFVRIICIIDITHISISTEKYSDVLGAVGQ